MCDGTFVDAKVREALLSEANSVRDTQDVHPVLENCQILDTVRLHEDRGLITLKAPRVASRIQPGQFVHLRVANSESRFTLRRPLSVCRYDADQGTLDIYYQVKGGGTAALLKLEKGTILDCVGPLGQAWTPPKQCSKALLVGGGVGSAPLAPLYRSLLQLGVDVQMIRGAQNARMMADLSVLDFDTAGRALLLATDDGSVGHHGFVTVLVRDCLEKGGFDYVATCGPEPMQKLVAALALEAGVYCEVSLERRMACGIGACLSCVVDTVEGKKRACVEGPVFDASVVIW